MTEVTVSERGFHGYAEFRDSYGVKVRVHESSAAMGPHVWVALDADGESSISCHLTEDPQPYAGFARGIAKGSLSSHLNVEQATALRDALTYWLEEIPERWGE